MILVTGGPAPYIADDSVDDMNLCLRGGEPPTQPRTNPTPRDHIPTEAFSSRGHFFQGLFFPRPFFSGGHSFRESWCDIPADRDTQYIVAAVIIALSWMKIKPAVAMAGSVCLMNPGPDFASNIRPKTLYGLRFGKASQRMRKPGLMM